MMKMKSVSRVFTALFLAAMLSFGFISLPENVSPAVSVEAAAAKNIWKNSTVKGYGVHKYYDSKGRETKYQIAEVTTSYTWGSRNQYKESKTAVCLKINGKIAKQSDIPFELSKYKGTMTKFGDFYYGLGIDSDTENVIIWDKPDVFYSDSQTYAYVWKDGDYETLLCEVSDYDVYDILTGKKIIYRGEVELNTYLGSSFQYGKKFRNSIFGEFIDKTNKKLITITRKNGITYKAKTSELPKFFIHFDTDKSNSMSYDKYIVFTNNSTKKIKYVTFTYSLINSVGDPLYDDVSKQSSVRVRYTGPLGPGETDRAHFENFVWTKQQLFYIRTSVVIEYMDGSFETIK